MFSDWEQNITVAKSKDERQAHVSKVSVEVGGLLQEIHHRVIKGSFNSRR